MFTKGENGASGSNTGSTEKTDNWSKMEAFITKLLPNSHKLTEKMQKDFEDLHKRNQKEVDKLLDLLGRSRLVVYLRAWTTPALIKNPSSEGIDFSRSKKNCEP